MAQAPSSNHYITSTMTLFGQGHVSTTPDLAVIRLGVQTTGSNLSQIQPENAQITQRVIQALLEANITDIRTIQYTIDKVYEYEDGRQIDKGYAVQNILEIRTNQIEQVGSIVDTAVNMGANVVSSISFVLSEPELYYKQALNLAVEDAIQKAKAISATLHVRLNPIPIRIIEGSTLPAPMQKLQFDVATTPIISGDISIEAFITADFLYTK